MKNINEKTLSANELRPGNWLNLKYYDDLTNSPPKPVKITGVNMSADEFVFLDETIKIIKGITGSCNKIVSLIHLHPIPLTMEVLKKAGYDNTVKKADKLRKLKFWDICSIYTLHSGDMLIAYSPSYSEERLFLCRYVHQLQNAHFAMTGEELNIEL